MKYAWCQSAVTSTSAISNWNTIHVFVLVCVCMHACVCICSCMYASIYVCMYVCVYVTVRVSNQGFSQIPKTFRDFVKSLFHSGI